MTQIFKSQQLQPTVRLRVVLQAEADVFEYGQMRKKSEVLENHARVALFGRNGGACGRLPSVQPNFSRSDGNEAGDGVQDGGLATRGGADQGKNLVPGQLETHVIDNPGGSVVHTQLADFEHYSRPSSIRANADRRSPDSIRASPRPDINISIRPGTAARPK